VTGKHPFAILLLLIAGMWVALVNGQPLFMADTTAYVRGPDYAIVHLFGNKYATSWTQQNTLRSPSGDNAGSLGRAGKLDSAFNRGMISGRSIYYGVLLYLGHLTSNLWLAVLVQAAVFLYLSHTFLVKCLRLSFYNFVWITSAVVIATPISFFISFLMPDIFASFLIIGTLIIVGFWDSLSLNDKLLSLVIVLYSTLAHTSHLLLLICLCLTFLCVQLFVKFKQKVSSSGPKLAFVLMALVVLGLLGDAAVSYSVRQATGTDLIRPPFLTARLIADGPGYDFIQKNCAKKPYVVCDYINRLPTSSYVFLWSPDPDHGVFDVADLATRRALSLEQESFALDVLRFDPIGVMRSATKDFIRQFVTVGLDDIFLDQQRLASFKEKIPQNYFGAMLRSRIVLNHRILSIGDRLYSFVYLMSAGILLVICVIWPWVKLNNKSMFFPVSQWAFVLTIPVAAIIFNAGICGILSEPAGRYQGRISWVPVFMLLALLAKFLEAFLSMKREPDFARQMSETVPRPLRFLGVGGIGLLSDIGIFTIISVLGLNVLVARLGSLAIATLVTWQLNRALTFERSGREQHQEALRYFAVTAVAQGTSYAVFAILALTVLAAQAQLAILIGAVVAAGLSYNGHFRLTFSPKVAI